MGDVACPVDKDTDLAVYFLRERGKVPCKLGTDAFAMEFPPVNPFESIQIA
jgi:hypothetical protein